MALLENIKTFVRVVELGSLSAAGRHLRLSAAVVSHRVQTLEGHLGVRLLNRTTRQVQTTEQGSAFYAACLDVLQAVEAAESSVAAQGGTPRGNLRVTAPLGLGRRVLAPLVPEFQAAYPHVEVRLRLSDHLLDLLREAVDVAIRMATLEDSGFVLRKIADCRRILCAAPILPRRARAARRCRRTCSSTSACCCAFPAPSSTSGHCRARTARCASRSPAASTPTTATC